MNLAADYFSDIQLGLCWLMVGLGWLTAWRQVDRPHWHECHTVWAGMMVGLSLLWVMKAGFQTGLSLHFLGATVAVLTFGWALALLGLSLVLAGATFNGGLEWAAYPANALVSVFFPVALSHALFKLIDRRCANNIFVYLFVSTFFSSGVVVFLTGALTTSVLAASGAYPLPLLLEDYLPYFILLGFSEAWLSGMCMTLLVVFMPGWVRTFADDRYLAKGKPPAEGESLPDDF